MASFTVFLLCLVGLFSVTIGFSFGGLGSRASGGIPSECFRNGAFNDCKRKCAQVNYVSGKNCTAGKASCPCNLYKSNRARVTGPPTTTTTTTVNPATIQTCKDNAAQCATPCKNVNYASTNVCPVTTSTGSKIYCTCNLFGTPVCPPSGRDLEPFEISNEALHRQVLAVKNQMKLRASERASDTKDLLSFHLFNEVFSLPASDLVPQLQTVFKLFQFLHMSN